MRKFLALLGLLRRGAAVADPTAWRRRQITVSALVGLLLAATEAARAFGVNIPLDEAQAGTVAAGLLAAVNVLLTVAADDQLGLPPSPGPDPQPRPADPQHPEPTTPSVDASGS